MLFTGPKDLAAFDQEQKFGIVACGNGGCTDDGASEDFTRINHVPVMFASLKSVGHEGTFSQANGGAAAAVAVDWLEWQLRGSDQAAKTFSGPECSLCVDAELVN